MAKHSNVPPFFMVPRYVVDEVAFALTREELLVLLYAMRHILGWEETFEARKAHISMTAFAKGRKTKTGTVLRGTGLGETAIRKALNGLVDLGLIDRIGKPTEDGQLWGLPLDYETDRMAPRIEERQSANQKRIAKARASRALSDKGGSVGQGPLRPTKGGETLSDKGGGTFVEQGTYIDTSNKQSIDILAADAAGPHLYPCAGNDISSLISAWLRWTPQDLLPTFRGRVVDPSKHYANKTIRTYAEVLWQRGYRPNDVIDFLRELISRQKFAPDAYISSLTSWSFAWVASRVEKHAIERRKVVFYTYDAPRCFPMHPKAQSGQAEAEALALWFDGLDHTITGYSIDLPCRLYTANEYELLKAGKPLPEEDDES